MSHKSRRIDFDYFFNKSKKRQTEDDDQISERESKNPRIEINNNEMIIDDYKNNLKLITPLSNVQEENEVSSELKKMSLNNNNNNNNKNINEIDKSKSKLINYISKSKPKSELNNNFVTMAKGVCCIAQNIEDFTPFIKHFLDLGKEIISLYEKAEHNKELCSFLLQRSNCAMATVRDLYIRKTENEKFFLKKENLSLFKEFIKCIKRIKNFIEEISHLGKYRKFLHANNIEETFSKLITEFDGYMNSLNFSFTIQAIDEFKIIKNETREIKELLLNVYGVSDDNQSQQNFLKEMDSLAERNKEFQKQSKLNKVLDSSDFRKLEVNEPLLDGNNYQKTKVCPSKRIEKRLLSSDNNQDFCFKEFSNNNTNPSDESQIEIRRQVNILKELKVSDHIVKFFGVAQENSKFYLVTEWMEYGNLHEYYTDFGDKMNWDTKIRFALDICCGISYLNDCQVKLSLTF
jgi:hypothetical protein